MRFLHWFAGARVQLWVWTAQTIFWLLVTPLIMLTGIRNAVSLVSFLSLYALIASCGTAAVAALAYVRAESADRKAGHVLDHSPHIPDLD